MCFVFQTSKAKSSVTKSSSSTSVQSSSLLGAGPTSLLAKPVSAGKIMDSCGSKVKVVMHTSLVTKYMMSSLLLSAPFILVVGAPVPLIPLRSTSSAKLGGSFPPPVTRGTAPRLVAAGKFVINYIIW